MLALNIFLLVLGLALLVEGADWFVDGSAGIARKCKISPLGIGLTIVAFGTSAPELAVSVASAITHSSGMALGNVLGSNITNILLILGISSLLHKMPVQKNSLWLDLPVLLFASILIIGLGWWGNAIEWWDGIILLTVFAAYLAVLFVNAFKEQKRAKLLACDGTQCAQEEPEEKQPKTKVGQWYAGMKQKTWFLIVLTVIGLGMVVGGGTLLVNSAKAIARACGVSEPIIALTVVALGTSLPELVTSVVAAVKGNTDIAVGNVIGSNIFNIFVVAGISSLIYALEFTVDGMLVDSLVALGAAALLMLFALFKGHSLGRAAGAAFTLAFVGYYVYLFIV